ncbi:hypothetical protein [Nonomuraea sp. NPDC050540]|uniref:hypothetical protein n=2 Tax=unclassified Nonomuraea TaxID=2593643 RepID=UPI0037B34FE7
MHEEFSSQEVWSFGCHRCQHMWEQRYSVRTVSDDHHGGEIRVWKRGSVTVQPPWVSVSCPGCGAYQVTCLPYGFLSRHPELTAAPEPRPLRRTPPAAPKAAPVVWPTRLLAALGLPVLAFVGYELWHNLAGLSPSH